MSFFEIIKMILPLLFISGLLYGLLVITKRFSFNKGKQSNLQIKVLSTQMLMPKKFVSVVKVNDQFLVLGLSEGGITLLKELDPASINLNDPQPENQQPGFGDIFKKLIQR